MRGEVFRRAIDRKYDLNREPILPFPFGTVERPDDSASEASRSPRNIS